jgi:enamine deaminase RidA (YjgF/YER057c/UK114 family)
VTRHTTDADVPRFESPEVAHPPVGQYSQAAIVPATAAVAHIAGQLPLDPDGQLVSGGDFSREVELAFANLVSVLDGVGSSLRLLTFLRAYVTDGSLLPAFKDGRTRAYESHGVDVPPPATTVVVTGLYGGSRVELEATAIIPTAAPDNRPSP